jgi:hypothetical protein
MALSMDQLVGLWGPCVGDSQPPATARIERVCTDSRGDLRGRPVRAPGGGAI